MSKLAIVGASGLVGRNLLEQLQKREFKIDEIFLLGKKSAGYPINFLDKNSFKLLLTFKFISSQNFT